MTAQKEEDVATIEKSICFLQVGKSIKPVLTEEFDHRHLIMRTERVLKKIAKSNEDLFTVQNRQGLPEIFATKNGQSFLALCKADPFSLKQAYPNHNFNPYMEVLAKHGNGHEIFDFATQIKDILPEHTQQVCDRINDCIHDIRKEIKSSTFQKVLNHAKRSRNKNNRNLKRYIKVTFAQPYCGKLLSIRIDCSYKEGRALDNPNAVVSYLETRRHRREMMRHIQTYTGNAFAGCVCKLEYGLLKGYHYHYVIFLKGSMVRMDSVIAKALGEHWETVITKGHGMYYNCNANKYMYKYPCLGELHHNDPDIWLGLNILCAYLTKTDYHLRIRLPKGHRSFWKTKAPNQQVISRGRKRKKPATPETV